MCDESQPTCIGFLVERMAKKIQSKTKTVLLTLKYLEEFPNLIFNCTQNKFVDDHKCSGLTHSNNGM